MTEAEAIAKVRKLYALADRAGTEAEAALAADRAQAILTAYKLEASQIHVSLAPPDPVDETLHDLRRRRIEAWQAILLGIIARTNYCKLVYLPSLAGNARFTLIGKRLDRQIAAETWEHLRETVQHLTQAYRPIGIAVTGDEVFLTGTALRKARTAFALGCASAIRQRLKTAFEARTAASPETTALVVTSATEVAAATKRLYPRLVKRQSSASTAWSQTDHLGHGREAGASVNLAPQRKLSAGKRSLS